MPAVISKYVDEGRLGRAALAGGLLLFACKLGYPYLTGSASPTPRENLGGVDNNNGEKPAPRAKQRTPGFDRQFLAQLMRLVRLLVPGLWTKEVALLAVHTLALVTRTFMSIYVATMEGRMVKYIVRKDVRSFSMMLIKWLGVALPATFLNSLIRYLESKIALAFR
ncbi:hypothetical protein AAG570_011687 [Ranatra chinensis]|uniref:ABC transmembrane type-1 domain-containing protein n=1 Tax=Ranatra chinensis TaxID=642074 RepID=A0ABD0Z4Y1_9HEMI